jgi:hypothetical protein
MSEDVGDDLYMLNLTDYSSSSLGLEDGEMDWNRSLGLAAEAAWNRCHLLEFLKVHLL